MAAKSSKKKIIPATTPEGMENQLIAASMNLAAQRILDGTASNQLLIHFLKLGSTREKYEKEKLKKELNLMDAKTENLESQRHSEDLYQNAIDAMRKYQGNVNVDEKL